MYAALVIFGSVFTFAGLLAILFPYVRRRGDLLTSYNLFLLGSVNFVGIASIQSGLSDRHYIFFTSGDVARFIAGAIVFYVVLAWTYHRWRYPMRAATRRWQKWARPTTGVLLFVNILALLMGLLTFFAPQIPGLAIIALTLGIYAVIFAVVFSFIAWYSSPLNPFLAIMMALSLIYATIILLSGGISRQPLLSVCLIFPISLYWLKWRYRGSLLTLAKMFFWGLAGLSILGAFSVVRINKDRDAYNMERAIDRLTLMRDSLLDPAHARFFGGDATEVSLAVINRYNSWHDIHPFYTFYYVLSNPIPRLFWPDKPESLGTMMPRDLGVWERTGYVNWGPGVVGHGYHEGGLIMLVFYGVVIGGLLRLFDQLLIRQPHNPYILSIFCTISGTIIAFPRGDWGIFTMQILGAVVTGLLINWIARFFTRTTVQYSSEMEVIELNSMQLES